ncbi:hypothetical protein Misp06_04315 [Microbulbifer sp. NBRC 101763]
MRHHNRHLVVFITFLSLVPLVYFIPDGVAQILPDQKFLQVVVAVGIIVPVTSYLILPLALYAVKYINNKHIGSAVHRYFCR